MNFQSELFFRNVLRKQYLFLPTGQLSKSKEKRKNKKECFLWATHHTPGYTHQWEFIPSYQVSSIKYRPLPQWFHLNQYALFINIKLLRRISSKSLLKLTFHISKFRFCGHHKGNRLQSHLPCNKVSFTLSAKLHPNYVAF